MNKLSFVIHENWNKFASKLNKEDAGELFLAMCLYQQDKEYVFDNPVMEAYFESIIRELEADKINYQKKCEKAKKAIQTRWDNTHVIHDDTNVILGDTDVSPSICDSDNDNVNNLTVIKDSISPTTQNNNLNINTTTSANTDSRQACREVVDQYNMLCKSLPKVEKLSQARVKAIRARLKTFSKEDLIHAFSLAESSRFLCGSNDKNWRADFDWIIGTKNGGDQHLTRILEGAYIDRNARGRPRAGNFVNFEQRTDDLDALVQERTLARYGKDQEKIDPG